MGVHITVRVGIATAVLVAAACGGGSSSTPTGPSSGPSPINIVGDRGSQSFNPNPATVSQGQMLSWRNSDNQIHRIVFNDGSFDSGNIAPGATSTARPMPSNGGNYHCSIHPTMIGGINSSSGAPPPCTGLYC